MPANCYNSACSTVFRLTQRKNCALFLFVLRLISVVLCPLRTFIHSASVKYTMFLKQFSSKAKKP